MRLVKLVQVISRDLSCGILLTTAHLNQGGNVSEKNVTEKVIKRGRIVPLASPHLPLLHNFQNATDYWFLLKLAERFKFDAIDAIYCKVKIHSSKL